MELRFDRSLPGRGGNDQSRLHSVAAAIPIKGNRQNFMGQVLNDLLTPDTRIWDFSPMGSGTAKTARESAKSPEGTLGAIWSAVADEVITTLFLRLRQLLELLERAAQDSRHRKVLRERRQLRHRVRSGALADRLVR